MSLCIGHYHRKTGESQLLQREPTKVLEGLELEIFLSLLPRGYIVELLCLHEHIV